AVADHALVPRWRSRSLGGAGADRRRDRGRYHPWVYPDRGGDLGGRPPLSGQEPDQREPLFNMPSLVIDGHAQPIQPTAAPDQPDGNPHDPAPVVEPGVKPTEPRQGDGR